MKIKRFIISIIVEDDDGVKTVGGNWLEELSPDDAQRMICQALTSLRSMVKHRDDITTNDLYNIAAMAVASMWQVKSREFCQELVENGSCTKVDGLPQDDVSKTSVDVEAALCNEHCDRCNYWDNDNIFCELGEIESDDQKKIDDFLES